MTTTELNQYIKHYIEKDKTKSAIMLSAPWGTGKSYYIQNILIPFLEKDNGKRCIVVSLYGLKDIKEISKSIFLEAKAKLLSKQGTGLATGKLVAKTVIKGVASFFGIDLNMDEDDLNKIYESIDLSDKLIVLEDLERSNIGIIELLGYVNSLVEQDGVKVLLVANELEIKKYNEIIVKDDKGKEKKIKVLTDESKQYFRTKEKTVSDTIIFYSSNVKAIDNIMVSFNYRYFNCFLKCKNEFTGDSLISDEIEKAIMFDNNVLSQNLRSFIFACQKTSDIFDKITFTADIYFLKTIFMGNVAFVLKRKDNDDIYWLEKENISSNIGTYKYPLYKFSYDYICNQYFDLQAIKDANDFYCKQKEFEKNQNELEQYFDVIYSYYLESEKKILASIECIAKELESSTIIPFNEYRKLANYLIAIKHDLNCDELVNRCKKAMINNVEKIDSEIIDYTIFHSGIQLETEDAYNEFSEFKNELDDKFKKNNLNLLDYDYSLDNLESFCNKIRKERDSFINKRCFAKKLDNEKLIALLKKCSANQISDIRNIFQTVYSFSNINEVFSDDKESLIDLRNRVEGINNTNIDSFDKI